MNTAIDTTDEARPATADTQPASWRSAFSDLEDQIHRLESLGAVAAILAENALEYNRDGNGYRMLGERDVEALTFMVFELQGASDKLLDEWTSRHNAVVAAEYLAMGLAEWAK